MRRVAPLLGLLAACAGPDFYPDSVGEALCHRLDACDPEALAAAYGAPAQCRVSVALSMDWYAAEAEGLRCPYDAPAARACLQRLRTVGCADLDVAAELAACGEAYGCAP